MECGYGFRKWVEIFHFTMLHSKTSICVKWSYDGLSFFPNLNYNENQY
jgi:hypothetical protein